MHVTFTDEVWCIEWANAKEILNKPKCPRLIAYCARSFFFFFIKWDGNAKELVFLLFCFHWSDVDIVFAPSFIVLLSFSGRHKTLHTSDLKRCKQCNEHFVRTASVNIKINLMNFFVHSILFSTGKITQFIKKILPKTAWASVFCFAKCRYGSEWNK